MVLPLLGFVFAAFGAQAVAPAVAKTVIGAELMSGSRAKRAKKRLEKENEQGINPAHEEFKIERKRKVIAGLGGDPSQVKSGVGFFEFELPAEGLSESKKFMAGVYFITEDERDALLEAAMYDGVTSVDVEWLKEVSERRRSEQL